MNKAVLYVHGKGGDANEAEFYKPIFPACDVIGFDYKANTPWDCKSEFKLKANELKSRHDSIILIANSIGAFFSMNAFDEKDMEKAYFISPIVDMEKLISDMMAWASVTEEQLKAEKVIQTEIGEALSYEYLCYVREHPIKWNVPTKILYGENDALTSYETMSEFASAHNADLTVMPGGEHWFHTDEQMKFLYDFTARYEL